MIDEGKAANISSVMANNPVIAFVFGQQGLMGDPFRSRRKDHQAGAVSRRRAGTRFGVRALD
jgi:hypothetical protein